MPKFEGFGQCKICNVWVSSGDFVDIPNHGRHCVPCWWKKVQPRHPLIAETKSSIIGKEMKWRCLKWRRKDSKLPNGPLSVKE